MGVKFVREDRGPAVIKAKNSNTISDEYRDSLAIAYSVIGGMVPDTTFEFCGKTFDTPVMAGPIGVRGEGASYSYGKGVNKAGSLYWIHDHDKESHTKLLEEGADVIRVIKPLRDVKAFIDEVVFETEHGAMGYATDISHGLTVYGELDGQGPRPFGPKTIDDLIAINEASPLPFFIKDIMSVKDAVAAKEAGVAGIIISNHNNRFPCAVPPLMLLPMIREAVGTEMKVFIDGGLNTGYDVFKALALGADGVLCARTLAAAFAQGGEDALAMRIAELTAELKGAMASTGSPDLAHINRECIIKI